MTENQKATLTQLANTVFELTDTRKEINGKINAAKADIESIVTSLGVTEVDIDDLKFIFNSRSSSRFKKSEFAKDVNVDKKEVNEQLVAQLVEKGITSSELVGTFLDVKASRSLKIKKVKVKTKKNKK